MRYEYCHEVDPWGTAGQQRLNQLGREGWRVIAIGGSYGTMALLERKAPDPMPKPLDPAETMYENLRKQDP